MSKKCTPLWREAHLEVKMLKTLGVRTTFGSSDLEKVHAVVARRTFRSKNVQNTRDLDHFWRLRCRFVWQAQGIVHLVKSEQNLRFCNSLNYNHRYTTLHSNTVHNNYNYTFTSGIPFRLPKPRTCDPYKRFCKALFCRNYFAVYWVFVVQREFCRHSCLVHKNCSNCMNHLNP